MTMNQPQVNKLKLPPVKKQLLEYDSSFYSRSKLPPGFEGVKLSIPTGYVTPAIIPPEIAAKAQSLLKRRSIEQLPFNYNESHTIIRNGKPVEYLLLVNMHFDNHPRMKKNPNHPPFWHPGVSVFEKVKKVKRIANKKKKRILKNTENNSNTILNKEIKKPVKENTSNESYDLTSVTAEKIYDLVIKFARIIESNIK